MANIYWKKDQLLASLSILMSTMHAPVSLQLRRRPFSGGQSKAVSTE